MSVRHRHLHVLLGVCAIALVAMAAFAQEKPYEPVSGQAGKDAVWVPTPFITVEKMMDVAEVTPKDLVIDLGSGDGRNVIAAAKRGARAVGVEFDEKLVQYSRELAEKSGVADKATFVQHDMFTYDISQATVLALFLLPEHFTKLLPQFLATKPGTRIVINTFRIPNWDPDVTTKADGDCGNWCTVLMWIVPAKVAGTWRMDKNELTLKQDFQKVSGTMSIGGKRLPISEGKLRGDSISFTVGKARYTGRVDGNSMSGEVKGGPGGGAWTAVRK